MSLLLSATAMTAFGACASDDLDVEERIVRVQDVRSLADDGNSLVVLWEYDPCPVTDSGDVEVTEDENSVTLTVRTESTDAKECPAAIFGGSETIVLSQPLGDRELIDGSNDRPLSLTAQ